MITGVCLGCKEPLLSFENFRYEPKRYCSGSCKTLADNDAEFLLWLEDKVSFDQQRLPRRIKRRFLALMNCACEECGWNKRHPIDGNALVQVDHVDGDPTNNARRNLRALCPNCHSMTETHGSRNQRNPLRVAARITLGRLVHVK